MGSNPNNLMRKSSLAGTTRGSTICAIVSLVFWKTLSWMTRSYSTPHHNRKFLSFDTTLLFQSFSIVSDLQDQSNSFTSSSNSTSVNDSITDRCIGFIMCDHILTRSSVDAMLRDLGMSSSSRSSDLLLLCHIFSFSESTIASNLSSKRPLSGVFICVFVGELVNSVVELQS